MKKRLLAIAMTLAMVLSLLPGTSLERTGYTLQWGTQICGKGLTGWLPWYSGSLSWTHSRTPCFCSAAGGDEMRQLTWQQYRWLMEGLQIDQPKALKEVVGLRAV